MARVLIVEDEPAIAMGLQDDLALEGFDVDVAGDGASAEELARRGGIDLILLDVMLPKKDGFAVCRSLREAGIATPIVMLTARGQEIDRVVGLELGADDYVTKPFSPRELVARIKAVLRRTGAPGGASDQLSVGALRVDFRRFEAWRGTRRLALTPTEFRILQSLHRHRNEVVPINRLMDEVWGPNVFLTDRVIYTHINNLRGKVEDDPSSPALIAGIRGVGYRLDA
jgi:DNA-binding response OmpR family regulator